MPKVVLAPFKIGFLISVIVAVLTMLGVAISAAAQTTVATQTLVALDKQSKASAELEGLANTAATYLTYQLADTDLGLYTYGQNSVGDLQIGGEFLYASVEHKLAADLPNEPLGAASDHLAMLNTAYDHFTNSSAPPDSRLIILTPGTINPSSAPELRATLKSFTRHGWLVDAVVLSTLDSADEFAELVAQEGAQAIRLTSIDGFGGVVEYAKTIAPGTNIGSIKVFASDGAKFSISPYSRQFSMLILLGSDATEFTISRPDGSTLDQHDYIADTPHLFVFRSSGVAAYQTGTWTVKAHGTAASLTVLHNIDDGLDIRVLNETIPLGREFSLLVAAESSGTITRLEDASVTAVLGGKLLLLNDAGVNGDAVLGDGIFSAHVQPISSAGPTSVDVRLEWGAYNYTRTVTSALEAVNLPTIDFNGFKDLKIATAGEWLLGELDFTLDAQPYSVDVREVSATLVGGVANSAVRLEPVGNRSKSSIFKVWGSPPAGDYGLLVQAKLDGFGSQAVTVRKFSTKIAIERGWPPSLSAKPSWLYGFELRVLVVPPAILIAILALSAGLVIRHRRMAKPCGYIYDQSGSLLVDFKNLRPPLWYKLIHPNLVRSKDIPRLSFLAVSFKFTKLGVVVVQSDDPSKLGLRIKGSPAPQTFKFEHGMWLGCGGKLLQLRDAETSTAHAILKQDVAPVGDRGVSLETQS